VSVYVCACVCVCAQNMYIWMCGVLVCMYPAREDILLDVWHVSMHVPSKRIHSIRCVARWYACTYVRARSFTIVL
jgi:hypothetical protein